MNLRKKTVDRIWKNIKKQQKFQPVLVTENSNWDTLAKLSAKNIPGIHIGNGFSRVYEMGPAGAQLFGYVGAIAPAPGLVPGKDWAMSHPGMISEEEMKFKEDAVLPEVLMVCCGTNDGTVGQFPKTYHNIFKRNEVDHIWFEVMGADHNSHAIRSGFYQFMLRVFK